MSIALIYSLIKLMIISECPAGTYGGLNCTESCSIFCANKECDPDTGACQFCNGPRLGLQCEGVVDHVYFVSSVRFLHTGHINVKYVVQHQTIGKEKVMKRYSLPEHGYNVLVFSYSNIQSEYVDKEQTALTGKCDV